MDDNEDIPDDILEFAHAVEDYYEHALNDNGIYILNSVQYRKLLTVAAFMKKYSSEFGGVMDEICLIPNLEFVDVSATVDIMQFCGEEELNEFIGILKLVSNIDIYADLHGKLHVSVTVADCYIKIM
jgi:hypothetical protein